MSRLFLRVKDCSGYRPVAKACARMSGKPGPQGNAQKKQTPINGATFNASIAQTTYLQSLDYRYNIKGQLLTINNSTLSNDNGTTNGDTNDLFGMTLLYDQQDGTLYNGAGNTAYHNGKLSAVKWMNKDANGNSTAEKSYVYSYDPLNRLTGANYSERAAGSAGNFGNNVDAFDENGINYDENGNILSLNRTSGGTSIDQLMYSYNGNQLTVVADASGNTAGFIPGSGSYGYDANGNITTDPYKGLANYYNVMNRVEHTVINNNGTIYYTYTASGTLLRKQQYNTANALQKTTDYIDGFEYEQGALNYFGMPEGRVLSTGGALKLEFIMSDQQGNARISFDNSGTGGIAQVKQENSYYAFGMTYQSITPGNPNLQLYNGGSEWQRDYGDQLPGYYQTFYRNYDAALGRWISVDPEAESLESMSGYQYSMNNPVMFNDPMGNKVPLPGSKGGPSGPAPDEFAENSEYSGDGPDDTGWGGIEMVQDGTVPGAGFVSSLNYGDFWDSFLTTTNNYLRDNPNAKISLTSADFAKGLQAYNRTGSTDNYFTAAFTNNDAGNGAIPVNLGDVNVTSHGTTYPAGWGGGMDFGNTGGGIWGKMYIMSNVSSNADLTDGHAWIRLESKTGTVTTMSLYGNRGDQEFWINLEINYQYVASKEQDITNAQYNKISQFNSDASNINWTYSYTCAGYSAAIWNYVTGDSLSASDMAGTTTTPRALTGSIQASPNAVVGPKKSSSNSSNP